MQPIGISGTMVSSPLAVRVLSSQRIAGLLLSVAANQTAVALQAARLRMQAELERHRMQDLLAKAPAAIGLLAGPEHRWVYVNEDYFRVTGRNSAPIFSARPCGKLARD